MGRGSDVFFLVDTCSFGLRWVYVGVGYIVFFNTSRESRLCVCQ